MNAQVHPIRATKRILSRHDMEQIQPLLGPLRAVIEALDKGAGQNDALLINLLVAGLFVVLSPREWMNCYLVAGNIVLAETGKSTTTLVRMSDIDPDGRRVVEDVLVELAFLRSQGQSLPRLFRALRERLYRLQRDGKAGGDRRITLTSTNRWMARLEFRSQVRDLMKEIVPKDTKAFLAVIRNPVDD